MTSRIKNIIVFVIIGAVLILVYIFLIKKSPDPGSLTSIPASSTLPLTPNTNSSLTGNFLSLLLNVKGIKLDDTIFSDGAFINLRDSSILLVPDGTEGRPNPFAPFGFENVITPISPASAPLNANNAPAPGTPGGIPLP